jgi:hypothetical protein
MEETRIVAVGEEEGDQVEVDEVEDHHCAVQLVHQGMARIKPTVLQSSKPCLPR